MSDRCIVNVTFGDYYLPYQERLKASVAEHAPDVATMFWTNEYPPGSPDQQTIPYAFKFWAIKEAAKKYRYVLWLDAGAYVTGNLDKLWERIERDHLYIVNSSEQLGTWASDSALNCYGVKRDQLFKDDVKLLCGMPYGFDMADMGACEFFVEWVEASKTGLFNGPYLSPNASITSLVQRKFREQGHVSNDPRCHGHRHDEAIGALIMLKNGMKPSRLGEFYQGSEAVIQSGYTLPRPMSTNPPIVVANHSVIFPLSGPVLDVGAYRYDFSKGIRERGGFVVAMEPNPDLPDPDVDGIQRVRKALVGVGGPKTAEYVSFGNGTENHLAGPANHPSDAKRITVECIDIVSLMKELGVTHWSCVKLNCEGGEYEVLRTWPGPISDSISVAFHDHINANPTPEDPEATYAKILAHLGQWYRAVSHEKSERYGCLPATYWDTTLILKEGHA